MKTYYSLLDIVRFFAAFWVMNFHYLLGLGLTSNITWYRYGNLGVQLFFIISGFVIVESLKGKTWKEFATGRFIRLFPLFWILCTVTYIITLIVPGAAHAPLSDYWRSMTMLGDIFDGIIGPGGLVDPSYWTLTVELLFYVGIAAFVYSFSYKNIRYFLGAWLVVSALAFLYHVDENFYVKLLLVRHASYFVFGGILAFIAKKEAENIYHRCFDWSLLFVSAFYSVYIHVRAIPVYITPNVLDNSIVSSLLVVFFITIPVLVYASSYIKNERLVQACTVIGGLTYPLYLLHQTIGNTLINYVTNRYTIPWNTFAIGFEVFIIAVAYLVYREDKKMRLWLKQKFTHGWQKSRLLGSTSSTV